MLAGVVTGYFAKKRLLLAARIGPLGPAITSLAFARAYRLRRWKKLIDLINAALK